MHLFAGYGDMAIANALGSNLFDMLFCLGLPWLADYLFVDVGLPVPILDDLRLVSLCLVSTAILALVALPVNGWKIDMKISIFFVFAYVIFITINSIYETSNSLPVCDS